MLDTRKLAEAIRDSAVADLADHRALVAVEHRLAKLWLADTHEAPLDLTWCALALDMTPGELRADIRRRVKAAEAVKEAHAEDLRRRRAPSVRLIPDHSSWAGHAMFAALVVAVTGGEWVVEDGP